MSQVARKQESHTSDQVSGKYQDTDSQVVSSQADFIQPLEDSQDINTDTIIEGLPLEQPSQNAISTRTMEVNYFSRPTLETTEEIGATFQFQKAPPPRMISHGPGVQQRNSAPQSVGNAASQCGQNLTMSGLTSQGGSVTSLQANDREGIREYSDNCQDGSPANTIVHPQKSPQNVPSSNQPPRSELPGSMPAKDINGFPFPDDASRNPSGGKMQRSHRSLGKPQLPKAISDTRRKALAQISPRNSLSRQIAVPSPPANHTVTQKSTPDRGVPHGTKRHSEGHEQPMGDQLPKETGGNEEKRISTKSSRNKRHKAQGLTRPISLEPSEYDVISARPCSQASISSKLQAYSRTSHKRHTPTREQNSKYLKKFAESWNTNYLYNQRLLDRLEDKISSLESRIASQDCTIIQYEEVISCRDQEVDDLSAEIEHLHTQNKEAQSKVNTSDNVHKKLEDKLRSYKARLNDAIGEQQRLFIKSKEICQKVTEEVKAEERVQKESIEEAFAALGRLRAKITQEIAAVAKDSNGQVDELNKTIKSLENELRDREKELERERQHTQDLTEQLSEIRKVNDCSLQSVAVQNQELLYQMKQDREHAENAEVRIQKQEEKLDTVLKTLEQMSSKTLDPIVVMEKLREVHSSMATTIIEEFQNSVILTQNSILEDQDALNESITEIHQLCEDICEKLSTLNDVEVWQERVHHSDAAVQIHTQRVQHLQDEVNQLHMRLNEQIGMRDELERQVATATMNEQATNEKIKNIKEQTERLQRELSEKELIVSEANKNLQVAQEELREQVRVAEDRQKHIQNERETHEKAIELSVQQHKQELSHAITEKTNELRERNQNAEKRLKEVEAARVQLEEELTKSRQEGEMIKASVDEDIRRIRSEIMTVTTSIAKMTAGLEGTGIEQEALRGILEAWSRDRVEVDQMKHILRRLANDQPNAIQMSDQLKQLLEIQKKMRGTLEYHQAEVTAAEADVRGLSQSTTHHGLIVMNNPRDEATYVQEESQGTKRKVMVKSPVDMDDHKSPMSVEQERSTRRHAAPLRGIMKVTSNDILVEAEEDNAQDMNSQAPITPQLLPKRGVARRGAKPTLTTRSTYNRPVAGSIPEKDHGYVVRGQAGSNGDLNYNADTSEQVNPGSSGHEPPSKKQRILRTDEHEARGSNIAERVKLSRSMSISSSAWALDNEEAMKIGSSGHNALSLRGGPMKRKQSGLVTYGKNDSDKGSSYNQSSTVSGPTEEVDSQSTQASCRTDSQAWEQDVLED
ncbi:hypothetical protein Daesc_002156 [Daldinia eschscholtzii]|uniref:Uncharacterized protein n=1 Tax=Daldinia eschscholtzii TaxID=292717 RepID=A0AAX6MWJ9_9PEZI